MISKFIREIQMTVLMEISIKLKCQAVAALQSFWPFLGLNHCNGMRCKLWTSAHMFSWNKPPRWSLFLHGNSEPKIAQLCLLDSYQTNNIRLHLEDIIFDRPIAEEKFSLIQGTSDYLFNWSFILACVSSSEVIEKLWWLLPKD